MRSETLKLEIIDRLMKIDDVSALKRMEELITQAEMESRSEESLKAIEKGDVLSIDSFRADNEKWRNRHIK